MLWRQSNKHFVVICGIVTYWSNKANVLGCPFAWLKFLRRLPCVTILFNEAKYLTIKTVNIGCFCNNLHEVGQWNINNSLLIKHILYIWLKLRKECITFNAKTIITGRSYTDLYENEIYCMCPFSTVAFHFSTEWTHFISSSTLFCQINYLIISNYLIFLS